MEMVYVYRATACLSVYNGRKGADAETRESDRTSLICGYHGMQVVHARFMARACKYLLYKHTQKVLRRRPQCPLSL